MLGQLAQARAWGINYLLGVGPTKDGEMGAGVDENMAVVADWMKRNGAAVAPGAKPLPKNETASVCATARGPDRFLFAISGFKNNGNSPEAQLPPQDETLTLGGEAAPKAVTLLGSGASLAYSYDVPTRTIAVALPTARRTTLVDAVKIEEPAGH